jgi:hypothetical protein
MWLHLFLSKLPRGRVHEIARSRMDRHTIRLADGIEDSIELVDHSEDEWWSDTVMEWKPRNEEQNSSLFCLCLPFDVIISLIFHHWDFLLFSRITQRIITVRMSIHVRSLTMSQKYIHHSLVPHGMLGCEVRLERISSSENAGQRDAFRKYLSLSHSCWQKSTSVIAETVPCSGYVCNAFLWAAYIRS